ncbi:Hypothetical protein LBCNRZ327_08830 [Lactobacillus delbrueckii subsp. lactis]|nr:Hypothetical protein LBCNRZ327_08830 [Lactobacillus delbrueckii subsp. lactis]
MCPKDARYWLHLHFT